MLNIYYTKILSNLEKRLRRRHKLMSTHSCVMRYVGKHTRGMVVESATCSASSDPKYEIPTKMTKYISNIYHITNNNNTNPFQKAFFETKK